MIPCLLWVSSVLAQEAQPTPLRFAWPPQGSVRVQEEALKKGRKAELTYVLRWHPAEDGTGTLLDYTEFDFVALEGFDLSDPAVSRGLAEARAMAGAIPTLRLDAEGRLLGFVGYEELLERMLAHLSEGDRALEAKLGATLRQPDVQQAIESRMGEIWRAWVGNWIDLEFERGTEEVWEMDLEGTGGLAPELQLSYGELAEHRGLACVEITMEAEADEELLLRRTLEMMGVIAAGVEVELPERLPLARATRHDTTHGIYAIDGLRPLVVETSSQTRVWESATSQPVEQLERHRYVFEWSDLAPAPDGAPEGR